VEAKFVVETPEAFNALMELTDLSARYTLSPGHLSLLTDTYYDTQDHALLRSGWVLRIRQGSGPPRVTLKGVESFGRGAVHGRIELEGAVAAGASPLNPAAWPESVRDQVLPVAGAIPVLVPLAVIEQARQAREVCLDQPTPEGAVLPERMPPSVGELSFQRVTVSEPDRAGIRHGVPEPLGMFSEIEFELKQGGSDADLDTVVRFLEGRQGLSPATDSKLERALRLMAQHAPGGAPGAQGVQPDMPMAEAGRLMLRVQLTQMLLNEFGARQGEDIEFVHDMRVATRRARAALALFGNYFMRKARRPLRNGLRMSGRALGRVRDLDVVLYKLNRYRRQLPPDEAHEFEPLATHWRQERLRGYEALLACLDSDDYRKFLSGFSIFCVQPGAGVRKKPRGRGAGRISTQVRHIMPAAILDRFARVRGYEAVLGDLEPALEETLHPLRIDCKRLRYTLEFVRHLLVPEGEKLIKQLKKLQDHLGDLNDAAVARDTLHDMQALGQDLPALRKYLAEQVAIVERLRTSFPQVWHPFIALSNREVLMRAVARL
jgi:CHAD domain-containing protein